MFNGPRCVVVFDVRESSASLAKSSGKCLGGHALTSSMGIPYILCRSVPEVCSSICKHGIEIRKRTEPAELNRRPGFIESLVGVDVDDACQGLNL